MAKRKTKSGVKPKKKKLERKPVAHQGVLVKFKPWQKDLLAIATLAVAVLILFAPLTLQQKIYPENDNIHFRVVNKLTYDYQDQTGQTAYWNPNPWGGIPNVFKIPRSALSVDFYLTQLSDLLSLPFVFFLWGSIGLYFLAQHLRFSKLLSALAALIYILMPYSKALVIVGHVDKIQALNHLPWVLWSLLLLLKKPKLLHLIFFALAFSLELRSNHYQVTFYGAILLAFVGVAQLWKMRKNQPWLAISKRMAYLGMGGALALLIAAEPFLIAFKNSGRSVRSHQVLRLSDETSERKSGVSKSLVKNWSFSASELATLLVPRAKGGLSDDVYPSAHYIGFPDGKVSTYWGTNSFNATYYYSGLLLFLLLGFTFLGSPRGPTFWGLLATTVLVIIWSLGTQLGWFYDLCYAVIPFFKNFRTPTTSLSMLTITLPLLSLYGLHAIRDFTWKKGYKKGWLVIGIFALLGLLLLLHAGSATYLKSGENAVDNMVIALQGIRKEMLLMDIYRYFIILLLGAGLGLLFIKGKINFQSFAAFILALTVIDFALIQQRYPFETVSQREFNRRYLDPTSTVRMLQGDPESFRVFPFATSNFSLPAHVQTFGGGSDLQMSINAFEVTINNLHHRLDGRLQLNWNVMDMMNIKYVVSQREIQHDFLTLEHTDQVSGLFTYRYKFNRPRGYFVDKYEVITDPKARLQRLNERNFDARSTAILERNPSKPIRSGTRSAGEVIHFSPNKVTYNVDTPMEGLFVMSDIYAPEAQEVYLDGDLVTDVYSTNHLIQSIFVPEGFHTVEIRYKADIYRLSFWLTRIGLIMAYIVLGFLLFRHWQKNKLKPNRGELAKS